MDIEDYKMKEIYCTIKECIHNLEGKRCRNNPIRIGFKEDYEFINDMKAECSSFSMTKNSIKKGE